MNGLHCGRMTTDQIGTEHQVWGAPQPSPGRWGWRESVAAVAVAAVIAALGGAAIYAATEGSSHSFGAPHQAFEPGGSTPGGPGGQHSGMGGPGRRPRSTSLHGESVVRDGAGGSCDADRHGRAISPTSPFSVRTATARPSHSEHGRQCRRAVRRGRPGGRPRDTQPSARDCHEHRQSAARGTPWPAGRTRRAAAAPQITKVRSRRAVRPSPAASQMWSPVR
jgi:hypothetical protein